jgi:hypothetical protein
MTSKGKEQIDDETNARRVKQPYHTPSNAFHIGILHLSVKILLCHHTPSPCLICFLPPISIINTSNLDWTYEITFLQFHELFRTHVLVHIIVVGKNALAIDGALYDISVIPILSTPSASIAPLLNTSQPPRRAYQLVLCVLAS